MEIDNRFAYRRIGTNALGPFGSACKGGLGEVPTIALSALPRNLSSLLGTRDDDGMKPGVAWNEPPNASSTD